MANSSLRYAKKKKLAFDLFHQGRYGEACVLASELRAKNGRDEELRSLLGHTYFQLGKLDDARRCFRAVVENAPKNWKAHADLANAAHHMGDLQEAVTHFKEAIRLDPTIAPVWDNLGISLCCQGKYHEAVECHRRALAVDPRFSRAHSNLLLTLHYLPDGDPEELFNEHQRWGAIHTRSGTPPAHSNSLDPERRLRVGYVSGDFRTHSVAYFIEPLIASHDRDRIAVWCYANLQGEDTVTKRLRDLSDHWRCIAGQDPAAVARQVQADQIDILVDLAGHTSSGLLALFAHKPAPIQVTYLGYPDTTGLPAIDYRLCDAITDPPDQPTHCTEELFRLPDCFLCYQPYGQAPPVSVPPAAADGHVVFGSFNNLAKINPLVVEVWAKLLDAVPGSHLLIKNPSLHDAPTRDRYTARFRSHGVPAERLELRGPTDSIADHLALYSRVDIALDTFPYNGTTTTCEALWMGVPVVTLCGTNHAARVSASLLATAGLHDWVSHDLDGYLEVASRLANTPDHLAAIRRSLRDRVASSPLCDPERLARNVEQVYRTIWRCHCESSP